MAERHLNWITVEVDLIPGMTEAELTQYIRLKKFEFGKQLQEQVTKYIRGNLKYIVIPEPQVAN